MSEPTVTRTEQWARYCEAEARAAEAYAAACEADAEAAALCPLDAKGARASKVIHRRDMAESYRRSAAEWRRMATRKY